MGGGSPGQLIGRERDVERLRLFVEHATRDGEVWSPSRLRGHDARSNRIPTRVRLPTIMHADAGSMSVRPVFDRECITAVVVEGGDFDVQYRAHTAAFRR